MRIELPWLNRHLSSNARIHWAQRQKLVRSCRNTAHVMTLATLKPWERDALRVGTDKIHVFITYLPPDNRRRDRSNMDCNLTMKAYLDGIADAIGVDDNRFVPSYRVGEVTKGGGVIVEMCPPRVLNTPSTWGGALNAAQEGI